MEGPTIHQGTNISENCPFGKDKTKPKSVVLHILTYTTNGRGEVKTNIVKLIRDQYEVFHVG